MNHLVKAGFHAQKPQSQIAQKHERRRKAVTECLGRAKCKTDEDMVLVTVFALTAKSQGKRVSTVHRRAIIETLVRMDSPLSTERMRAALDGLKSKGLVHELQRTDTSAIVYILSVTETGSVRLKTMGLE